ncbi:hypothetical protein WG907_10985 [Sphingobium sp. AN558]|uniref:hypothetical protein n=1 Tax=Sphingobium sp. AN558 TaxID=3133442 RepID=UPI0030C4CBB6
MTRTRPMTLILSAMLCSGIVGCGRPDDQRSAENIAVQTPSSEPVEDNRSPGNAGMDAPVPPTGSWVGRWTGPEGLFLDIRPAPNGKAGHYALINKDTLDRQGDYSGVAQGTTIRFMRDGKDMTIRPGSGAETGFKYLAGKSDCLIIVPGQEGYCR